MRERRWLLLALYGLLLATAVSGALKATRPKFKIATTSTTTTTTEEPNVAENEDGEIEATTVSSDVNATTGHTLTGIPQIDYIWDPNLPRELNGFNLSDYPFYSGIPEEINFKCDGLHDGFYASVPHKCQVYHHCLFGTRFDFLCANFTAFDQKTFICHFASEVDCANSKKYWHRNDALYKTAETTTTSTSTTSTTTTTTTTLPPPGQGRRPGRLSGGRRPGFRRRPAYDYYEDDYYEDEPGYERTRPRGYDRRDDYDYEDRKYPRRDRERDRDFRDRDYRDRDFPRTRDHPDHSLRDSERPLKDDREVSPLSPRERFPSRNNRRDPPRATGIREPVDDEPRNRNRDQDGPIRSRDQDGPIRSRDQDGPIRSRDQDGPIRSRDQDGPIRSRDQDGPIRSRDQDGPIRSRDQDGPIRSRDQDGPIRSRDQDGPIRSRDQDGPIRSRDPDELVNDKKSSDSRIRDVDDRRYSDKGARDDYEDEPIAAGPASSAGNTEILVKPAAPVSSVYARPRAPPKIRRPVPLAEQDKFAYKATSASPNTGESRRRPAEMTTSASPNTGESRRRPADIAAEDDYYEDEIEEVRPRRPVTRRRPGFRDFYESPRERDRDRPFRSRYRDEEDDVRPRKHPDRIRGDDDDIRPRKHSERIRGDDEDIARPRKHPERNRERYYERGPERGRDRSLDRSKDRVNNARHQESDRPLGGRDRDRDNDTPRSVIKSKEPTENLETTKRPNIYDRTSVAPPTTSTEPPKESISTYNPADRPERPFRSGNRQDFHNSPAKTTPKPGTQISRQNPVENVHQVHDESPETNKKQSTKEEINKNHEKSTEPSKKVRNESEEYSSDEYYDEPEYQPAPPPPAPRTTVRVVKRPFLPSRGGNPNPRGLLPVGSKAPEATRKEEIQSNRSGQGRSGPSHSEAYRNSDKQENPKNPILDDDKSSYDAYKIIQPDVSQKTRSDEYEGVLTRPNVRRPVQQNEAESQPSKNDNNSGVLRNGGGNRARNQDEIRTIDRRPIDETVENLQATKKDDNSGILRPITSGRVRNHEENSNDRDKSALKWNSDEYRQGQRGDVRHESDNNSGSQNRQKGRIPVTENSGYYSDIYANENNDRDFSSGSTGNSANNKQIINEVVTHHRLQDIPESEYDVTLNEALTPAFSNQESNLPSGFVLPIHRQLGGDAVLQSTENSYKVSRPYNQHNQGQQQQKAFVPSPQFLPLADIGSGNNNDRSRSVQYFRTPEAVHVTGPQYRHQRGPWHDYTGY